MQIVDNELIGEELLLDGNRFSSEQYVPLLHGANMDQYITEKLKISQDKPWMVSITFKSAVG